MNKLEFITLIHDWNWKRYKEIHIDLQHMNTCKQLLLHVLKYGIKEKRNICMDDNNPNVIDTNTLLNMKHLLLPNDFDWEVYTDLNHDLKNMNKTQATIHYILFGNRENRKYLIEKKRNDLSPKLTIISSLFKCDHFIDNYLYTLKILKSLEYNKIIIWNVRDSNNEDTNKKIDNFCQNKEYITLINKTKAEDRGLYDSWNNMLSMVDTELVCNFNADDKLHPEFINDYIAEFNNNKDINLLFSPLLVSKNINDTFNTPLPQMYDEKKIFINKNEIIVDNKEPDNHNYESKLNLLKENFNNTVETKSLWVKYDNVSIFDFFRIDGNNYIDINNYNLFTFCGCAPVWKIELFQKYGGFNENEYGAAADIELWLRYFKNEGNFKKLQKPYIIYYNDSNSYGHSKDKINEREIMKRKIIKLYHPLFDLIDTKIDVIVPYRDRKEELEIFITNFKKAHDVYFDYRIIICEQKDKDVFNRSFLINYGFHYGESRLKLATDVDLLYKKICLGTLNGDNKHYGINENKLSTGGGSIIFHSESIDKMNGYSTFYKGWGSEDTDLTYRLFFSNISIDRQFMIDRKSNDSKIIEELKLHENVETDKMKQNKKNQCITNNIILMQQVINYNLVYYYENKDKFKISGNNIHYKGKLFFEGSIHNDNLVKGDLYDIVADKSKAGFVKSDKVKVYSGDFTNGLPTGMGCIYSFWENICVCGLFLNGYIFKSIPYHQYRSFTAKTITEYINSLQLYKQLNINDIIDFKLYKNYVYRGLKDDQYKYKSEHLESNIIKLSIDTESNNKFCNLHFSKKLNPAYDFIKDDMQLNGVESLDSSYVLNNKKIGNNTLYYFDDHWQFPVITEKRIFEIYNNSTSIPTNYFAFPWATLIDKLYHTKSTTILNFIMNFKHTHSVLTTTCQHISFRRLLPLFKHLGITHVFATHCTHNDYLLEEKYNIKIIPHPLYPVNDNKFNLHKSNKYLCSFVGSYDSKCYLSDIRDRLNLLKDKEDTLIKIKNTWHFNDIVYNQQIHQNDVQLDSMKSSEMEYSELLMNSIFSLCPNGSGPNTIRFWESLSYGSIPVLLCNEHKLPDFLNWSEFCILYNDRDISGLYDHLNSIDQEKINYMSNKCVEIFKTYFSKEKFDETIYVYFCKNYDN